jgi:hypothetical protein
LSPSKSSFSPGIVKLIKLFIAFSKITINCPHEKNGILENALDVPKNPFFHSLFSSPSLLKRRV